MIFLCTLQFRALNGQGSDHVKTNGHTSIEQLMITPQNDISFEDVVACTLAAAAAGTSMFLCIHVKYID